MIEAVLVGYEVAVDFANVTSYSIGEAKPESLVQVRHIPIYKITEEA